MEIAIIGMSGRFPGAADLDEFCDHLRNGTDSVRPLTLGRMRSTSLPPLASYKHLAFLENIDTFDYRFFELLHSEAAAMAPQQRIMLEMVYEAIERAGYAPDSLRGTRTAVYMASNALDYHKLAIEFTPTLLTGNLPSCMSGRIARYFNFTGAALQVDTACSSSLVALHLACEALKAGDASMAVCGGINLFLFPPATGGDETGITSPTAKCRTFSASADGAGMGEGGACVLLKPLDQAIADKDPILAIVKASAVNQDAHRSSTLTAPSSVAQAEVITAAIEKAGIDPATISFIEAHGTGTVLGDPIEIEGLKLAFEKYTDQKQFCAIAALKSNIGHTDAAAGLLGVIKTLLSFGKKELFPSLHVQSVNPMLDLVDSPFYINTTLKPWVAMGQKRRAGVSAFGISGTNCHVILEEWLPETVLDVVLIPYLFCISARDPEALQRNCKALENFLLANEDVSLQQVSYTLNTGRQHFACRVALVAASREELIQQLRNVAMPAKPVSTPPETWFLFSPASPAGRDFNKILCNAFPAYDDGYESAKNVMAGREDDDAFTIASGYAFYTWLQAVGVPVKQVLGIGSGKEITALISGKKTLETLGAGQYTQTTPRWDEFVTTKLKHNTALVCEIGIGAAFYKQLQPFSNAAHPFEVINPAADLSLRGMLKFTAMLFLCGFDCDLRALYAAPLVKIALPTYQFEPLHCWLRTLEDNEVKPWVHQLHWEVLSEDQTPRTTLPSHCIVYTQDAQAASPFVTALKNAGHTVTLAYPGTTFQQLDGDDCSFNWLDEIQYQQCFAMPVISGATTITHIHLAACLHSQADVETSYQYTLYPVLLLAKTLSAAPEAQQLVVITDKAVEIIGKEETLHAEQAALHGLLAGIRADIPALKVHGVDVDWEVERRGDMKGLLAAVFSTPDQLITGLRHNKQYGRKLGVPVKRNPVLLHAGAVYLLTGAASGIGLQLLLAMSWNQATFVVIGRRHFPHPDLWPFITAASHPLHYEAVQGFLQVISNGSKVIYFNADVADRKRMKKVIAKVKAAYGPVRGIIHAAGIGGKARIQRHTVESFRETLLPKVHGTLLLHELTRFHQPDFFIVCSSHNVLVAAERESNYSAANAFLDSFAHNLHKEGIHGMTIRWPFWSETGMGFRMRPYNDFNIPPSISVNNKEGAAVFDYLLQQGYTDVLIAKTDPFAAVQATAQTLPAAAVESVTSLQQTVLATALSTEAFLLRLWQKVLSRETILPEDNFFQLGGHSLLGLQIRNQVEKQLHIKLEYRDIAECPTIRSLGLRLRSLSLQSAGASDEISTAPVADRYPLSEAQQGLWMACQSAVNKSLYNVSLGYQVKGVIDFTALQQAARHLMQQHEILRTGFFYEDDLLFQRIAPMDTLVVPVELITGAPAETMARKGIGDYVFDLSAAPLFRIWLLERGTGAYELLIAIHHIIVDGWSAHLFLESLFHTYGLFLEGNPPAIFPGGLQFKDYAVWEAAQLSGAAYRAHQDFWKQYLRNLPLALQLPADHARRAARRGLGDSVRFELTAQHLHGFNRLCQQESVSKFLLGLSMLQLLLYRYTGQPDFFIGIPSSLRNRQSLEKQLGYYVNMLPMRCEVTGTDTFYSLLQRAAQTLKKVQDHQVYPFPRIVKAAGDLVTVPGRHPLFDLTFAYEHQPPNALPQAGVASIREMDLYTANSKYDLEFVLRETDGKVAGTIMYDTDLYSAKTVQQIADHFIRLADMVTLHLSVDNFIFEDNAGTTPVVAATALDFNF